MLHRAGKVAKRLVQGLEQEWCFLLDWTAFQGACLQYLEASDRAKYAEENNATTEGKVFPQRSQFE